MMNLRNKKIVVVGLGLTGLAAARFLHQSGAKVMVSDSADEAELTDAVRTLKDMGVAFELGPHRFESFQNADMLVISPGVPHTIAPIRQAEKSGVPIVGEIELASRFISEPVIAITGTNGKTTTTELVGRMLQNSGISAFVGGNIGNPLINYVIAGKKEQFVVAEVSSFQLDTIVSFRPKVSVLLNITADHLDRYPNFESYADSKIRIFANQQADDVAVLNGSDPMIRAKTKGIKSQRLFFPDLKKGEQGAILNGKKIILSRGDLDISKIPLQGRHNYENACAASLAAMAVGATLEGIQKTLIRFKGLVHRLEHVATLNGVHFYNDSKATNVDGVLRALECFSGPVLLLMGGRDKGSNFSLLKDSIRKRVKEIIAMGEAAESIRSALFELVPTKVAESMEDAVKTAFQDTASKDTVLLSPGCASFDWYSSYAERGDDFRNVVRKLKKGLQDKSAPEID